MPKLWTKICTALLQMLKRIEDICSRFKKSKLKPVVGRTLAKEFNEMLAVDLKSCDLTMQLNSALLVWFQIRGK